MASWRPAPRAITMNDPLRDPPPIQFDDGAAYERLMGHWSRLAGEQFLDWLAPAPGQHWLDIGCGNGAFTELLLARTQPASVRAFDPSAGQAGLRPPTLRASEACALGTGRGRTPARAGRQRRRRLDGPGALFRARPRGRPGRNAAHRAPGWHPGRLSLGFAEWRLPAGRHRGRDEANGPCPRACRPAPPSAAPRPRPRCGSRLGCCRCRSAPSRFNASSSVSTTTGTAPPPVTPCGRCSTR